MNRYGLIGHPLTHSFSKKYFTAKFENEELAGYLYELFPLPSIDKLSLLLQLHPDLKGLNVTIPYKQEVLTFLHDREGIPSILSACNCIKIINGKLYGYNTDVIGFENSILPYLQTFHDKALILGNGGAAEAVKYAFAKNNIGYKVVGRKVQKGVDITYTELNEDIIAMYKIIVNTTPLGMYPLINDCPDIPYTAIGPTHHLFDLVYNPAKTMFLEKGQQRGATIQNGGQMLLIQAEESWNIWQKDVS